jgi:aminopeptidase N
VASGREVSRETSGDRQLVTFAAGPARDFYLAASTAFEVISQTAEGVTFNSYAPAGETAGAQAALEHAIAGFQILAERYGPYPYTEFDLVATPTYALGVEYPGIVAITDRLYDLTGSLNGVPKRTLMESVVVHEAGHQWFYNLVGNDQLDEPWLDESLAQFITWQYYLDRYGAEGSSGFEQALHARWARVDSQPIPIGLPVSEYEGAAYSAIVYGRGAFFFDALRERLGNKKFDAFMQEYTRKYTWGIASGEGLKALAEETCACDLSGLYEDWVEP